MLSVYHILFTVVQIGTPFGERLAGKNIVKGQISDYIRGSTH
jgi:hypothetical protein